MTGPYAVTDGAPAPATTETNSTPSTQADLLTNSPATRWQKPPDGLAIGPRGGLTKRGRGRPKNSLRADPSQVHKNYNLQFDGGRRYKILFTSMSDATVMFETDVLVPNLRKLMMAVAYEIGAHRKAKCARHFTVTCTAYPPDTLAPIMQTENIAVQEVNGLLDPERPVSPIEQQRAMDDGLEI